MHTFSPIAGKNNFCLKSLPNLVVPGKSVVALICLSTLFITMAACTPSKSAGGPDFKQFVKNINDIETKLGKTLASKDQNSVVCVPSAQVLLGLLYAGAGGKTASELESLFGADNNQLGTLENFKNFVSHLQVPEIKIANAAYVAQDISLKKDFVEKGDKYFNVSVNTIDFTKKAETAKTINSWVAEKTEKLITELISADDLDENSKLVLLNAIYFKGKWQSPFKHDNTRDGPFKVSNTKEITVKQMSQMSRFEYAEDNEYKYLIMPYKGSSLSMLIVLPKEIETFEKKDISKINLDSLKFEEYRVSVVLPKFKIESTIDWAAILQSKIPSAFDSTADLKGIADVPLRVSKMIQKAFIKVDEEGTEAAAATAVELMLMSLPVHQDPGKEFHVESPFHYCLRVDVDSVPLCLFQGSVAQPSN